MASRERTLKQDIHAEHMATMAERMNRAGQRQAMNLLRQLNRRQITVKDFYVKLNRIAVQFREPRAFKSVPDPKISKTVERTLHSPAPMVTNHHRTSTSDAPRPVAFQPLSKTIFVSDLATKLAADALGFTSAGGGLSFEHRVSSMAAATTHAPSTTMTPAAPPRPSSSSTTTTSSPPSLTAPPRVSRVVQEVTASMLPTQAAKAASQRRAKLEANYLDIPYFRRQRLQDVMNEDEKLKYCEAAATISEASNVVKHTASVVAAACTFIPAASAVTAGAAGTEVAASAVEVVADGAALIYARACEERLKVATKGLLTPGSLPSAPSVNPVIDNIGNAVMGSLPGERLVKRVKIIQETLYNALDEPRNGQPSEPSYPDQVREFVARTKAATKPLVDEYYRLKATEGEGALLQQPQRKTDGEQMQEIMSMHR